MKSSFFYNVDHARQYLNDSIIRVNKIPVLVKEVAPGLYLQGKIENNDNSVFIIKYVSFCGSNKRGTPEYIASDSDLLDMSPMPLGFLSTNKEDEFISTGYMYRIPVRNWKIGLNQTNTFIKSPDNSVLTSWNFDKAVYSLAFIRMVLNSYVSVKEARCLGKEKFIVAFCSRWAVGPKNTLYYKNIGQPVGSFIEDTPILRSEYMYLSQILQEDLTQ